jgi:hypothetical protein
MAIQVTIENLDALTVNSKYEVRLHKRESSAEIVAMLAHGETYHDVIGDEFQLTVTLVDTLSKEESTETFDSTGSISVTSEITQS